MTAKRTRTIYRNHHISLVEVDVPLPHGGTIHRFPRITHDNGVIVVPIVIDRGKKYIMLLEQWRAAMDMRVLEVPGGGMLDGESPRDAAVREVREEAGLTVERLVEIGPVFPAPGWDVETQFHFIAECHARVRDQKLDVTENIRLRPTPLGEVRKMLARREIKDLKTKALLYDALDYLGA